VNDWVEGSSGNVLMVMEQWRYQQQCVKYGAL